ncbi:uncharacterized protein M421DRAFT_416199 [Didymella exigua CBS 183.55]|uniref:Uncharacterized protein n=1 Tax=Didymella exigua CBS 183.55 TaxID=1150837 RepID=A0A6A5S246_9PLEO|nr:uncharacterized protein M421DRAFT_416199 [Didymella exigua CBS 183.55]KAF1932576.1 hypothetical protein M421DRAFT_416199 [Didymella exigua CBS 183.55]
MSSQTSNSRFQMTQQPCAVCSSASRSSSSNFRKRILAPSSNSDAPNKMAPKHFVGHGLRVPLVRLGQKRLHARSASDLAVKGKKSLLEIVKNIAHSQVSRLKSASRCELAVWIERAETLALGPHPKTELASTKKEDLLEALGLRNTAPKAKSNKVNTDAPRKPNPKKAASLAEDKMIAKPSVPLPAKTTNSEQKAAPAPKAVTTQKQISHGMPMESARVAQNPNKRNYNNADASTDTEQTCAKKTRVVSIPSPEIIRSPLMSATVAEAQVIETASSAPVAPIAQASQPREACTVIPDHRTSTKPQPLCLEMRDSRRSYVEKTSRTVGVSSAPHDALGASSLHSPAPSSSYDEPQRQEQPFLKFGTHGRGGDFEHDPDRFTGRGHQVRPSDLARRRAYEAQYRAFYQQFPLFPLTDEQKRRNLRGCVEGLEQLRREEVWMGAYRERYWGELVGHLWDCGCEMVGDGGESEEE